MHSVCQLLKRMGKHLLSWHFKFIHFWQPYTRRLKRLIIKCHQTFCEYKMSNDIKQNRMVSFEKLIARLQINTICRSKINTVP